MTRRTLTEMCDRPELHDLLIQVQKRWDAMPRADRIKMREAQRLSYVVGEFMMEHPEAGREYAEEIYEKVVLGVGL